MLTAKPAVRTPLRRPGRLHPARVRNRTHVTLGAMSARILVVDDEASLREMLHVLLKRHGYEVELADGQKRATELLEQRPAVRRGGHRSRRCPTARAWACSTRRARSTTSTQVIMVTAYATTAQAVQAMREGAYDYIKKPFKNDELLAVIEKAAEKRAIVDQNRALRRRVQEGFRSGDIVGKSAAMQHVMRLVERVASAPTSVLITGESGTGKELVARALHHGGERARQAVRRDQLRGAARDRCSRASCSATRRARSPAPTRKKEGLFRAADGGTLFLDEIGEMPLTLQVKLLRVLQERTVRPVGGHEEIPVQCRVVAATNRDLKREVERGPLPRGPLLPPQRDQPAPAAAARAARGHRRCSPSTSSTSTARCRTSA